MFKPWKNICAKKSVFLAKIVKHSPHSLDPTGENSSNRGQYHGASIVDLKLNRCRLSDAALSKLKLWKRSRGCSDDSDDTLSHSNTILSGTETAHPCCFRYVFKVSMFSMLMLTYPPPTINQDSGCVTQMFGWWFYVILKLIWLVVLAILEKWVNGKDYPNISWKNKHVPNHQLKPIKIYKVSLICIP